MAVLLGLGIVPEAKAGDRKTEKAALRSSRRSPETEILIWGVGLMPSGQEIWV